MLGSLPIIPSLVIIRGCARSRTALFPVDSPTLPRPSCRCTACTAFGGCRALIRRLCIPVRCGRPSARPSRRSEGIDCYRAPTLHVGVVASVGSSRRRLWIAWTLLSLGYHRRVEYLRIFGDQRC